MAQPPSRSNPSRRWIIFLVLPIVLLGACWFGRWYLIYGQYPVYRGEPGSSVIVYEDTTGSGTQLYVIEPDGSNPVRLTYHVNVGPFGTPFGSVFPYLVHNITPSPGPDLQGVYYLSSFEDDGWVWYWLPLNGQRAQQVPHQQGNNWRSTLSPDGQYVDGGDADGYFVIYNLRTQQQQRMLIPDRMDRRHLSYPSRAWSADSRRIAVAINEELRSEQHLYIYDLATQALIQLTSGEGGDHREPACHRMARRSPTLAIRTFLMAVSVASQPTSM